MEYNKLAGYLGHACGDAVGGVLEFINKDLTEDDINQALELNGGGFLNLAPGQVTDDTELTLALYDAVKKSTEINTLKCNKL